MFSLIFYFLINDIVQKQLRSIFIILSIFLFSGQLALGTPINISKLSDGTLSRHVSFFQEKDVRLTMQQAREHFALGEGKLSQNDSVSLGIGVAPVWLQVSVNNPSSPEIYRLSIETPWLDHIDTWLIRDDVITRHVIGGDAVPYQKRPMQYRHYAFEHEYASGVTQILIRIESLGPMAIPIRLVHQEKAVRRDIASAYQYGLLYGVMIALALYNLVLFAFIRQKEYGLYGLYLLGFVLNSLSYTGQLHTVITADYGKYFQDWLDIFLMITYSVAGLHFARILLDTKSYAARLNKFVIAITWVIPVGMLIGFAFDQLVFAMSLAFLLNCGFVTLFVAMGVYAVKAQKPLAKTFLLSSVTAASAITISTLAVAGFLVPYNDFTFKLIEVGVTVEAILLAMILAKQFRMVKADKVLAEFYARTDPLTQLNNRRGFYEQATPNWLELVSQNADASIILFDIDDFKLVNDAFGHSAGDAVLKKVASVISSVKQSHFIAGRWGGEEFILLLPNSSFDYAAGEAERLRRGLQEVSLTFLNHNIEITASFGVAGTKMGKIVEANLANYGLEKMINDADEALYEAKKLGKNKVNISRKQRA